MQKTIVAAAALFVASGAALAQSVTIYGVVDASIESIKGAKSVTRVTSDNLASSRLGFRGTEDLGGGLKAKFLLESSIKPDAGTADSNRFWSRSAWVGVEGGFGEVRLGRQDTSIGALAGNSNILGAQDYDDLSFAGTFSGREYRRTDNAITYILPKFADGFSAQLQYSTATGSTGAPVSEAKDSATTGSGTSVGFNVQYAGGPFGFGLGYIDADRASADGSASDRGWLLYGSYDFGAAKLTAYYNNDDRSTQAEDMSVMGIKVGVPVSKDFSLTAGVSKVTNVAFTKDADATVFALKGVYTLSKRTALYGLITTVDNDTTSNLGVARQTPGAGKNSHGIAFGVRHSF